MTNILTPRTHFKPFAYPWAYDIWKKHEAMHWLPQEVEFRDDIRDWNEKLSLEEKNLLTQLFRFFTQADIDVAGGYSKLYLPALGNHPELTMMMLSFGAREAIHIDAYSLLLETIGMPETEYKAFEEFVEMKEKHEFLFNFNTSTKHEMLKSLAVYSGFTEGMQLFSSFAILMNFERFNKMKGMSNIVRWSVRDESVHVEGMTKLFRQFLYEETADIDTVELNKEIRIIAYKMVELEDKFIDLCFSQGGVQGLTSEDMKKYIRFIANRRWAQLGFAGDLYTDLDTNPIPWLDWVVNAAEHTNFFEARSTDYSKGTVQESEIAW